MNRGVLCFLVIFSVFALGACGIGGKKQLKALKESNYSINSVDRLSIAGLSLNEIIEGEDLKAGALPIIGMAILQKDLPIQGIVNLQISNDTKNSTHINQFKYKIEIADKQLFEGTIDENVYIEPNKDVVVPMRFTSNLFDMSEKNTFENILKDVFGAKEELPLTLKIKPSFRIGKKNVYYPTYISINKVLTKSMLFK
ncbi:MAG TPA: hypothetical protein VK102_11310 [Sphingobacterium sp.]|nr:hypothetical protein [Sphingobacterium sp.]